MASGTIKAVVAKGDIADNLTTDDSTKVLSAKQGKLLNDHIANCVEFGTEVTYNVPISTAGINSYDITGNVPTKAGYTFIGFTGTSETWRCAYIGFAQFHIFYAVASNGATSSNAKLYLTPLFKKNA